MYIIKSNLQRTRHSEKVETWPTQKTRSEGYHLGQNTQHHYIYLSIVIDLLILNMRQPLRLAATQPEVLYEWVTSAQSGTN